MRGLQIQRQGSTRTVLRDHEKARECRGEWVQENENLCTEESEGGESMHTEGEGIAAMYRLRGAAPQVRTGPGQVPRALHARFTLSFWRWLWRCIPHRLCGTMYVPTLACVRIHVHTERYRHQGLS